MRKRWLETRNIYQKILVRGTLKLLSPARIGNGENGSLIDMQILRDPIDQSPILTGTTLTGALRNYLRDWELGYYVSADKEPRDSLTRRLFGNAYEKSSVESFLSIDDAFGYVLDEKGQKTLPGTELRDGVSINRKNRIAEKGQLFDYELLQAGTCFDLSFELDVVEGNEDLINGLMISLSGLEKGEIRFGARKTRGFGECQVKDWKVECFDLRNSTELFNWLEGNPGIILPLQEMLKCEEEPFMEKTPDRRTKISFDIEFKPSYSFLIRSGIGDGKSADMIHLESFRNNKLKPILPGTSIAGALRSRAVRIAKQIFPDQAQDLVNGLFGPQVEQGERGARASKLLVKETIIKNGYKRVQTRVKIDRFTGGSYPTGLFNQQPIFAGNDTRVNLKLEIKNPKLDEIFLMMNLIKDLWLEDLSIGGEASVGRGRMQGISCSINYNGDCWRWHEENGNLVFTQGNLADFEKLWNAQGG